MIIPIQTFFICAKREAFGLRKGTRKNIEISRKRHPEMQEFAKQTLCYNKEVVMLYNGNWVYRCVYGCHYLMDIQTNTIVCISPILGELFSGLEPTSEFEMNFQDWCNSNGITTSENKETIIKSLIEKGILQYE